MECGLSGRKCCVGQGDCRRVWSVGAKMLRGSRGLSARVVCRDKYGEWVKRPVGGCGLSGQVWRVGQRNCRRVWSVGTSLASGSRELSAGVVCRGEKGEWVKGIGDGVWSVGSSMASGSRELSARVVCRVKYGEWVKGIGDGVWSVGTRLASESKELSAGVVCRDKFVAWVKRPVGDVWSVGVKRASEPKKPHISYAPNVANCHSDQNCQNPQNMIHLL